MSVLQRHEPGGYWAGRCGRRLSIPSQKFFLLLVPPPHLNRMSDLSPEHKLMLAILNRAALDYWYAHLNLAGLKYRGKYKGAKYSGALRREVMNWMNVRYRVRKAPPYSFVFICEQFGCDPDTVKELIRNFKPTKEFRSQERALSYFYYVMKRGDV